MELSNKKYNVYYAIFLIVTIFLFFLLITSRSWYKKGSASFSEDYNTVRTIGGYYVKISNAIYLTDTHQLRFTYSVKEISSGSSQGDEPEVRSVWLDTAQNELSFSVGSERISKNVTCDNADEAFKKVIIKIVFQEPDKIIEDKYDEFGDVIPGSVEKGKEDVERITIDKKDILFMTSSEAATMTTTKAVMTEASSDRETVTLSTVLTESSTAATTHDTSDISKSSPETATSSGTDKKKTTSKSVSSQASADSQPDDHSSQNTVQQNYYPSETQNHTSSTTQNITTSAASTQTVRVSSVTTTTERQPVQVNGIKLETGFEANNVVLKVNKSTVISAVVSPSNADNKAVSWSSNKPDIASVDSTGKIIGRSSGKAIITATTADGGLTASCMVTVSE